MPLEVSIPEISDWRPSNVTPDFTLKSSFNSHVQADNSRKNNVGSSTFSSLQTHFLYFQNSQGAATVTYGDAIGRM